MLNYGEPQILELMKNTLPHRLYPILFPMDDLRDAITSTKRVMTKESMDRQKTGQFADTPFMRVHECSQSPEKLGKMGVTFNTLEKLERQGDKIDRLTLLVDEMSVKIDTRDTPYKSRFIKINPEVKVGVDNKISKLATDHSVETGVETEEIITIVTKITGPITMIALGTITDMMTEDIPIGLMKDTMTIDQTIEEETTIGKIVEIDKIIEVKTLDREMAIEVTVGTDPEIIVVIEPEVGTGVETGIDKCIIGSELCQMTKVDQDLDQIQE